MALKSKVNRILLLIIALFSVALFTFNWGYELGEHKGYVEGMQWCLGGEEKPAQQNTSIQNSKQLKQEDRPGHPSSASNKIIEL